MIATARFRIRAFLRRPGREPTPARLASFLAGVYFGYLLLMLLELRRLISA